MPGPKKSDPPGKKGQTRNHVQFSTTADPKVLAEIERFAELTGLSRSAFLVVAAREKIERLKKSGVETEDR